MLDSSPNWSNPNRSDPNPNWFDWPPYSYRRLIDHKESSMICASECKGTDMRFYAESVTAVPTTAAPTTTTPIEVSPRKTLNCERVYQWLRSRYRPPLRNPAAIISPQFCAPYSVDLTIVRKRILTFGVVTDVNGNIIFKIKGKCFSLRHRRTLLNAAGNPILTLQRKMHKKLSVQGLVLGKDNFAVTVFPNVDYAFIVALVVVLEEINNEDAKG